MNAKDFNEIVAVRMAWCNKTLCAKGVIKKPFIPVKVLGNGTLTKALNVKLTAYSASAKEKIEKAGGKAEVI